MVGIYNDKFLEYLEASLGDPIKVTSKNIICRCPWCEYQKEKKHYHLYIALDAPIFHCFHSDCEESGTLRKLFAKIEGRDISDEYVDKEKLKEFKKKRVFSEKEEEKLPIQLPSLKTRVFPYKEMYIKKRFKFADIPIQSIKGLIFDVYEFLSINNIPISETLFRIKDYLHNNFIGFLTEHNSMVIFRNVDENSEFKFYKLYIQKNPFVDYYKLEGNSKTSSQVVLAEGVFDIFTEYIFDNLNIKKDTCLYSSVLSSKYSILIKSIVFHEQIFRPDVIILSDNNINLEQYQNLYTYNSHIINTLRVFYNKTGKDFNVSPLTPVEYIINKKRRFKK